MIYKNITTFQKLFNLYYDYIKENVDYNVEIEKKALPDVINFPTITFREVVNTNTDMITTNHQEFVDLVGIQVDIYTKDFVDSEGQRYSMEVQRELFNLTADFFLHYHFNRINYDNWENNYLVYDRLTLVFQGHITSWNGQIA